jgi:hypothetical protein
MSVKRFTCFIAFLSTVNPFAFAAQPASNCVGQPVLNAFERRQFVQVSLSTRAEVSAQYLAEPGCATKMLGEMKSLGVKIGYADPKSGYALVTVPREQLLATLDLSGIEYAYTRDDDRIYSCPSIRFCLERHPISKTLTHSAWRFWNLFRYRPASHGECIYK